MKLEYRDLSSSRPERFRRPSISKFGFLDFFTASLLIFIASAYFVIPKEIERGVSWVVYDSSSNSYASFQCIRGKTTKHQFSQSRDIVELRSSVRVVHHSELDRLGKPQPDAACYEAKGFVEPVSRREYFFGWLIRAVS
jgi:hypothetical protein